MDNLINFFFPPRCTFCNLEKGLLICNRCLQECKEIFSNKCIVCDTDSIFGTTHLTCINQHTPISTFCIFEYANFVRQCIKDAKYSKRQFMTLKYLARKGIEWAIANGFKIDKDFVVIPIPLSKQKQNTRGFNQAGIVAKIFAENLRLKMQSNTLYRRHNTQAQYTSKSKETRFLNVENVFYVSQYSNLSNKRILLVDDICTSGATLLEASKTLYDARAHEVRCITLAKTPRTQGVKNCIIKRYV
jgi:ComF family protein